MHFKHAKILVLHVFVCFQQYLLNSMNCYLVHIAHDRILPSTYGEHGNSKLVHSTDRKRASDGLVLALVPGTASAFASTQMVEF